MKETLVDNRPKPTEKEPETVEQETVPQTKPKKDNTNTIIWGVVILILIIGTMMLINAYKNQNDKPV